MQDESKSAFASQDDRGQIKRRSPDSLEKDAGFTPEKNLDQDPEVHVESSSETTHHRELLRRAHPFLLFGLAAVILGWWISATILKATRHRWQVTSFTLLQLEHLTIGKQDRPDPVCLVLHCVGDFFRGRMSWSSPCLHQDHCIPLHPQFLCHAPRLCHLGTLGFASVE